MSDGELPRFFLLLHGTSRADDSPVRFPHLRLLAASCFAAGLAHAASFDARLETLFRPPQGEMMALSPDGQRVAYTSELHGRLAIVIIDIDHPGTKRLTVPVASKPDAANPEAEPPVELRFLHWASANRLVYAPAERVVPLPPVTDQDGRSAPNPDGPTILAPIMAVDADGRQRGAVVDAHDFQETPARALQSMADLLRSPAELAALHRDPIHWRMPHLDVLGFLPQDRNQLVIGTYGAYSVPTQYLVDIRLGNVREFGGDWPLPPGEPQVYDWFRRKVVGERREAPRPTTLWQDEDLARMQRVLEAKFPRRTVELRDWSDTHSRVLFCVTGGSDPGRAFVFQRLEDLPLEIFQCAPWLGADKLNPTRWFEFEAPGHAHLSGYLTWPATAGAEPPPLLVVFPAGLPARAQSAFDPEAQVFADLGFAVARLNHRRVADGAKAEDIPALRPGADRIAVADSRAVVEWLATQYQECPFDRGHVAVLGRGFGGFLALRALQLQPALFRCGIAINAPPDLRPWLREQEAGGGARRDAATEAIAVQGADGNEFPVLDDAEMLTNPVLLLVEAGRSAAVDTGTEELRARLTRLGRTPDVLALEPASEARAAVYRKAGEFLRRQFPGVVVQPAPAKDAP